MKQNKITIIGSGISGIAAAIRLAAKGHKVLVLEQNKVAGGKIGQIKHDGFRFDTGPSLFTLPKLVDDLLNIDNPHKGHYFNYKKLENTCRYFYEDGTIINAPSEASEFADEVAAKTTEPKDNVKEYLISAKKLYNATADIFIFNPLNRAFETAKRIAPSALRPLLKINPLRTMHGENSRWFKSDHVIQLFDRYATYNGSSPYLAPSVLKVISHLEHNTGAYFPEKGMYNIVEMLYQKAIGLGVEFRFGTEATGLIINNNNTISGIKTKKGDIKTDIVVSDIDVNTFYRHTGRELTKPRAVKKSSLSSSAIIFYWGMERTFPELDIHNILFSKDYKGEFDAIFHKRELFPDPTVYIFISSKVVKTDAPEGCENWFVMINVPSPENKFRKEHINTARQNVIEKIQKVLNINPEIHIRFEEVATPETIQTFTGSFKGALYGNNSNSIWSAFLRHKNRSSKYRNLFFTGGSVHPGGGIPLCLASAGIVEKEIERI
ncbi:1-hydroxycarotenoid 3,4-desaturase CrtD [Anaerophaga thermohalophila]|uniref:1-hydroxycarotenoid 3,4-desaturase CrtD n=1 Tax=Anaerophaga thermohalophila TaxID=177400 RepID=UPI000492D7EF|nr:1-hydroxycarotenoid 3,4-desaturase CrtD [Anaerophaga thermohalophila]